MRNALAFLLLCLLISSCVVDSHRMKEWNKIPFKERMKIAENLDTRSNLFKDDENTLYVVQKKIQLCNSYWGLCVLSRDCLRLLKLHDQ